ncbi:hypothetical protein LJR168_003771 [Pseudoxanthomonas sp. LjRoot168]|uniref:hypothetical protein n=1 Tax=unclassified Pseudoxanthomonas TaxID=2645906 RepID=UPI003ECD8119
MRLQHINYHMHLADGGEQSWLIKPNASGRTFKHTEVHNSVEEESDAETESVVVEFVWPGGRRHTCDLTGDQHMDLEAHGLLDQWLARVSDGEVPEDALDEVLADVPRLKVA